MISSNIDTFETDFFFTAVITLIHSSRDFFTHTVYKKELLMAMGHYQVWMTTFWFYAKYPGVQSPSIRQGAKPCRTFTLKLCLY